MNNINNNHQGGNNHGHDHGHHPGNDQEKIWLIRVEGESPIPFKGDTLTYAEAQVLVHLINGEAIFYYVTNKVDGSTSPKTRLSDGESLNLPNLLKDRRNILDLLKEGSTSVS